MVDLAEHLDHPAMIDTRDEDSEQVREEGRLLLQVEREGLIVAIYIYRSDPARTRTRRMRYISMLATRTMTSLN